MVGVDDAPTAIASTSTEALRMSPSISVPVPESILSMPSELGPGGPETLPTVSVHVALTTVVVG